MALLITPGQSGDAPQLIPVMERIRVGRLGNGRPRTRPDHLGGDKAYPSRRNRRYLRRRQPNPPYEGIFSLNSTLLPLTGYQFTQTVGCLWNRAVGKPGATTRHARPAHHTLRTELVHTRIDWRTLYV